MNEQNTLGVVDPPKRHADEQEHSSDSTRDGSHIGTVLSWLRESGTMLLVLGLLGGISFLGHHTGWNFAALQRMFAGGEAAKDSNWCPEHNVPEVECVECNETLLPRMKSTWCRKHGVHDCPFERPEVIQMKSPPAIAQEDLARSQRALDLRERMENDPKSQLHHRRLQIASDEVLAKMGLEVSPVWQGPIVETIRASGEIVFEQPRVAPVSAPVAGRVWTMTDKGSIGKSVKKGDVLALIDAVEVGKAKADILQAYAQIELRKRSVDLLKPLVSQGVIPESRFLEADLALREARIRLMSAQQALTNMGLPVQIDETMVASTEELSKQLHFFGLPSEIAAQLDAKTTTANLMPVVAPRDGIVTAAKVTVGEMAEPGKPHFVVTDTRRMWLMLNVPMEEVRYLQVRDPETNSPGQTVKFRPDGSTEEVTGELIWKSAEVDDKTRTVRFRAELPNPDRTLLANTFGTGQIVLRVEKEAVIVPNEAVHWVGDSFVVFVRDKNFLEPDGKKVFHVRSVRPGVTNGPMTEIIAGVVPGEVVATQNSANLRAELLKNNLGSGCGCGH